MNKNGRVGPYIYTQKNVYSIKKINEFITCFYYKLSKPGSFTHIFTKIHNKAIYGHFFVSKTLDASHPQVNL